MKNQNINITSLLSECSLSGKMKNNISKKLINIINTIEELHTNKSTNISIDQNLLHKEIKTAAKTLVKKSDKFQKEIIETTLKRKEESMEMLEVSKLRIEAQIKDLQKRQNSLAVKSTNSFFCNLKNNLFKLLKLNTSKKKSEKSSTVEEKLKDYNLKLSNYDLEKDKLSRTFYENGSKKLNLLRKQTYYALSASTPSITTESINTIKEKIKHL